MLKQSTAFGPLMRKFAALAVVAMGASYDQIFCGVRAAAGQRGYVIEMVFVAYLYAAVVATALLALVLGFDDLLADFPGGAATMSFCAFLIGIGGVTTMGAIDTHLSVAFGISSNPFLYPLLYLFFVRHAVFAALLCGLFLMRRVVFMVLLSYLFFAFPIVLAGFPRDPFRVLEIVLVLPLRDLLRVFALPLGYIGLVAGFTATIQAVGPGAVLVEKFRRTRVFVAALRAALERIGDVQHSASLSLYHKMMSAGGVICRRFGLQSLADTLNYTTKRGISWLAQEAN